MDVNQDDRVATRGHGDVGDWIHSETLRGMTIAAAAGHHTGGMGRREGIRAADGGL
jgi:hypothetical protein